MNNNKPLTDKEILCASDDFFPIADVLALMKARRTNQTNNQSDDQKSLQNRMILGVMAQVAQFEAERIGERTREALAAAKARGVKLGGRREEAVKAARARRGEARDRAEALRGLVAPLVEAGQSQRAIAAALNDAGHRTERGALWSQRTIGRVIERLAL